MVGGGRGISTGRRSHRESDYRKIHRLVSLATVNDVPTFRRIPMRHSNSKILILSVSEAIILTFPFFIIIICGTFVYFVMRVRLIPVHKVPGTVSLKILLNAKTVTYFDMTNSHNLTRILVC